MKARSLLILKSILDKIDKMSYQEREKLSNKLNRYVEDIPRKSINQEEMNGRK